jgi:hypothetical protein
MRVAFSVLLVVLLVSACSHGHLVPAKNARLVEGAHGAAVDVEGGVRVVASLDDWRGVGDELPDELTPIKIRVVNHSARPITILNERFSLRGRKGHVYRAVPAIPLEHETQLAGLGPLRPFFAASNFSVAPRYHDVYPQLEAWPTPLARDESRNTRTSKRWKGHPPGRELCRMALPEGVLGPEGEITGYLYFEDPTASESTLTLDAELVSAQGPDAVASVEIPLRVD